MQISLVKEELAAAVRAAGIPNLDTYGFVPDRPSLPCFFAGEVEINPNVTFGGCDTADITCTVFVSAADDKDGQQMLDKLLSRSGTYSIRAALLAARGDPGDAALNGQADDLSIVAINGYRKYNVDDSGFYGADIVVRVIGGVD